MICVRLGCRVTSFLLREWPEQVKRHGHAKRGPYRYHTKTDSSTTVLSFLRDSERTKEGPLIGR